MGEHAQAGDHGVAQQRRDDRSGHAQDEQERGDVADEQVLGHVSHQQLV
jgi:hypothetical protein